MSDRARRQHRGFHPLRSVRVRITLVAVLVTAVAVGVAGWLLVRSVENAQIADVRGQVDDFLDQVANRLEHGESLASVLPANQDMPPLGEWTVTDEDGEVLATGPQEEDEQDVPDVQGQDEGGVQGSDVPAQNQDTTDGGTFIPDDQDDDENVVVNGPTERVTREVRTPEEGILTITAIAPVDQVARNVDQLTQRLQVGLPVLVALVGLFAWVLVGRALRPVEAIRAEVERIGGSTIHRRVPEPSTGDEVGRLAHTMNTMLDRLETSATEQRRFVADASHELRSPVAVIRAGLEVARGPARQDAWPAMVDSLLVEESRLEALLDDLLLLAAHDENGHGPAPTRLVDIAALAVDEARRPRRVPVDLVSPDDDGAVVVAGVQSQLARALSNLVDNAARHAASTVQLAVTRDVGRNMVCLVVDDDGPGIAAPDRERVFERFTRLDDGRARKDGGSGLGLAVVRSIASLHRGGAWSDDSPLGGARFVLALPAL
jgi:signal transduction histidine kinase